MPNARRRRLGAAEGHGAVTPGLSIAPPAGMRDLLPPVSMTRTLLWQRLMETFDLHGYQRVTTPPFEYANVIERGLDSADGRNLVRFVEPESGEVVLLRPDITPQVARVIATRLQNRPAPWRLSYEGTVVRRRRGRARRQQQVLQCGIECVGMKAPEADAEVIEVAIRACEQVGLRDFLVELAQVRIGAEVLEHVPESARATVVETLAAKDTKLLEALLVKAGVVTAERNRLLVLCDFYGDRSVIDQARRKLRNVAARKALDELESVVERLDEAGFGDRVGIDLSDLRRQSYYTGVSVTLLAQGPGEPLGVGGRYDHLLGRYGAPAPATGFAFDVDNVLWALNEAGCDQRKHLPLRAVVAGSTDERRRASAEVLRGAGVRTSVVSFRSAQDAKRYAEAWNQDLLVWLSAKGARLTRLVDGASRAMADGSRLDPDLISWARTGSES